MICLRPYTRGASVRCPCKDCAPANFGVTLFNAKKVTKVLATAKRVREPLYVLQFGSCGTTTAANAQSTALELFLFLFL